MLLDDAASVGAALRTLDASLGAEVGAVYALPLRVGSSSPSLSRLLLTAGGGSLSPRAGSKSRLGGSSSALAMPNAVRDLLNPFRKMVI